MNLEKNQKLFTKDGRKIGNVFVMEVMKDKVCVVDNAGTMKNIDNRLLTDLFHLDKNIKVETYKDVINITNESGMTFTLLREILQGRINKCLD